MSLRKRIQILLVFLVVAPMVLLLAQSYLNGLRTLKTQIHQEAGHVAQLQAARADLAFDPPKLAAEGLARAVSNDPSLHMERVLTLIRRTLEETPEAYGFAVAFLPQSTHLGRFAPYIFRRGNEFHKRFLEDPSYNYTDKEWFKSAVNKARGTWSRPYFDKGGGDVLMMTFSAPILRDGKLIGVIAADVSLDALVRHLRDLKPGGKGVVYLLSRQGQVLAHPDLPVLSVLTDHGDGRGRSSLITMMNNDSVDEAEIPDPVTDKESWVVESPLKSLRGSRGGEDWSLIVSWPLKEKMRPLEAMSRKVLVLYLILGGGTLLFLLRALDAVVINPLRRLEEQAKNYAKGDYSLSRVVHGEAREIQELGGALDELGTKLKNEKSPPGEG